MAALQDAQESLASRACRHVPSGTNSRASQTLSTRSKDAEADVRPVAEPFPEAHRAQAVGTLEGRHRRHAKPHRVGNRRQGAESRRPRGRRGGGGSVRGRRRRAVDERHRWHRRDARLRREVRQDDGARLRRRVAEKSRPRRLSRHRRQGRQPVRLAGSEGRAQYPRRDSGLHADTTSGHVRSASSFRAHALGRSARPRGQAGRRRPRRRLAHHADDHLGVRRSGERSDRCAAFPAGRNAATTAGRDARRRRRAFADGRSRAHSESHRQPTAPMCSTRARWRAPSRRTSRPWAAA